IAVLEGPVVHDIDGVVGLQELGVGLQFLEDVHPLDLAHRRAGAAVAAEYPDHARELAHVGGRDEGPHRRVLDRGDGLAAV
ncbi:hypothetical protein DF186_23035, partial [Enterococcus hirae]